MTIDTRLTLTNAAELKDLGDDAILGKAFVFLGRPALEKGLLRSMQRLFGGGAPKARVVSLLDRAPLVLPGVTVSPTAIPPLSLASVTSDKALYREGRDEVSLLALDPLAPGAELTLVLRANGADYGRRSAPLDAQGAAVFTLRDLPVGSYEVSVLGAPDDAPACAFDVATYKLAPLVASMADRTLEGSKLRAVLRLESFGEPVDGEVSLTLTDRGSRVASLTARAVGGRCEVVFSLHGEGPHAINVQLVVDPSRTATVPIVGSRAAERSLTTFSTLGADIQGSLLPSEGSTAVRGIYLLEAGQRSAPFQLDRADTAKARLRVAAPIEAARIVVIDPRVPSPRPGAPSPDTLPHPATQDERYRFGEKLFHDGKFEESRRCFEDALATLQNPHPNYAYYVACCHARLGDKARAMTALRAAVVGGWRDMDLLGSDPDLAALRGYPPYEDMKSGGVRELVFEDLVAGSLIEIDIPAPMAILAVGAFVKKAQGPSDPWEGWAAVIAPPREAPRVIVPKQASPGDDVTITVEAAHDSSVYVIVKDARLLTADTPLSRLAGGLKACAETASRSLGTGAPKVKIAHAIPQPLPPPLPPFYYSSPFDGAIPPPAPGGFGPPPPAFGGPPPPPPGFGPPTAGPMPMAPPAIAGGFGPPPAPSSFGAPPPPMAAPAARPATGAPPAPGAAPAPAKGASQGGPYRAPVEAPPPPPSLEEPEVLFAGLVSLRDGKATLMVHLGPDFAEYRVEAFAMTGLDWASAEARFLAEKSTFVSLDVPAFVAQGDSALGRAHIGARAEGARISVTRDGAPVPLYLDQRLLGQGEALPKGRVEVAFAASPGVYEARLIEASGAADSMRKTVEAPGKLRRIARTVRFLSPGERLSRSTDPSIVGLAVLPGLQKPFRALVDATADYGHACCEQTAAKMLSACAMYALAGDKKKRSRAEAIILAGVKREASMWLRGRGFKMYPESSNEPNDYWGQKAARYLWNLGLLRELGGDRAPSRSLAGALEEGLSMAADTTRAYRLEWPPRSLRSSEDAYQAVRFGGGSGPAAVDVARRHRASPAGGAVAMRTETAYAAATLLRAGSSADRTSALGLANTVVAALGENGRLYSTVDSVAAIALFAELDAAGIVGEGADVDVDGAAMRVSDACQITREIQSIQAINGVVSVEVRRLVEEDWDTFQAGIPVLVSLHRGSVATRRLRALDAIDLRVKIESGYKPGDLCWVCLPDALSRVVGGGQVKQFAVDFEGKDEVRIPLAATSVTTGPGGSPGSARFAVCVRNMFEEERGGNPGLIEVTVER